MEEHRPYFDSSIFNTNAFKSTNYLTQIDANSLYLSLRGGVVNGPTTFASSLSISGVLSLNNLVNINSSINDVITVTNSNANGRSNIKFVNDTLSMEFGIRGSTASNSNTCYLYFNGNYRMLMNIAGDTQFLSTTDSSAYNNGSFTLAGGLGVAKKLYCNSNITANGTLTIMGQNPLSSTNGLELSFYSNIGNIYSYDRGSSIYRKLNLNDLITVDKANNLLTTRGNFDIGQSLFLNDGLSNSALLSVNASNNSTYWQSPSIGGYGVLTLNKYGMYFNPSTGTPFGTCHANCLIDFGSKASPCSINLYGGTYSISANNSSLQLCTGGSNISFWNGASYDIGSYIADFSSGGSLTTASGVRIKGSNTTGYSGSSLELEYSGGQANIFAYNRSSLLYRPLSINNTLFFDGLGHLGIGQTVSGSWLMDVSYNTQSIGSYGYLTSSGSVGSSGSSGSVNFSARFNGRIAVGGELDVFSDRRLKSDIRDITIEEAELFVENIVPKYYIFKKDTHNDKSFGYIAQDIAKLSQRKNSDIQLLVCATKEEGMIEEIDDDGFISPKDILLTVNYQKMVAILHKYILKQKNRIEFLEKENQENNERIDELVDSLSSLDRSVNELLHDKKSRSRSLNLNFTTS